MGQCLVQLHRSRRVFPLPLCAARPFARHRDASPCGETKDLLKVHTLRPAQTFAVDHGEFTLLDGRIDDVAGQSRLPSGLRLGDRRGGDRELFVFHAGINER
ncbi:hypothetical protein C0R02_27560 [Streptomyces albidoflavus]|nr:hypothetical protein C0R02_27560 [Streptomyces albidoflavus]